MTMSHLLEAMRNHTLKTSTDEDRLSLSGWVRTNRNNGSIGFIELNDGTAFKNIQLVYNREHNPDFDAISKYGIGTAIAVTGRLVLTPEMKQPFEVHVLTHELVGGCAEDYPLQKKRHSFEYLRDIAHLRPRTTPSRA
jgi:asparaginyl-tRNA synthetase